MGRGQACVVSTGGGRDLVGDDGLGIIVVVVVRREGKGGHEKSDGDRHATANIPGKIRILKNLQSDCPLS